MPTRTQKPGCVCLRGHDEGLRFTSPVLAMIRIVRSFTEATTPHGAEAHGLKTSPDLRSCSVLKRWARESASRNCQKRLLVTRENVCTDAPKAMEAEGLVERPY